MRPIGANDHRNTGRGAIKCCNSAYSGHQNDIATEKTTNADVCDSIPLLISVSLDIAKWLGYKEKKTVRKYLAPLLEQGRIAMTVPDKPNSRLQKYITIH